MRKKGDHWEEAEGVLRTGTAKGREKERRGKEKKGQDLPEKLEK